MLYTLRWMRINLVVRWDPSFALAFAVRFSYGKQKWLGKFLINNLISREKNKKFKRLQLYASNLNIQLLPSVQIHLTPSDDGIYTCVCY